MKTDTTLVTTPPNGQVATNPPTVKSLLDSPAIKKRFEEILKDKAPGFMSSILTVVNSNPNLAIADPNSVLASAAIAAALDLPINQNLGFAHIVPYAVSFQDPNDGQWKQKQVAQFQMGWKGFVQLALRTGLYKNLNATEILAGQLKKYNPLTGEYDFDFTAATSNEVIGYAAYFKLTTGYEKIIYWNVGKIAEHGNKYSKSYKNPKGQWKTNFPAMALKTVVKNMLSQWGILSIEMERAMQLDQAVIKDFHGTDFEYADSTDISNQPKIEDAASTDVSSQVTGNDQEADSASSNTNVPNASDL